jgi:hypothetical protein
LFGFLLSASEKKIHGYGGIFSSLSLFCHSGSAKKALGKERIPAIRMHHVRPITRRANFMLLKKLMVLGVFLLFAFGKIGKWNRVPGMGTV